MPEETPGKGLSPGKAPFGVKFAMQVKFVYDK